MNPRKAHLLMSLQSLKEVSGRHGLTHHDRLFTPSSPANICSFFLSLRRQIPCLILSMLQAIILTQRSKGEKAAPGIQLQEGRQHNCLSPLRLGIYLGLKLIHLRRPHLRRERKTTIQVEVQANGYTCPRILTEPSA